MKISTILIKMKDWDFKSREKSLPYIPPTGACFFWNSFDPIFYLVLLAWSDLLRMCFMINMN